MADASGSVENSSSKTRFASLSDAQYKTLITERESNNTRRATDHAVKTFNCYLVEKGIEMDFEKWDSERLDATLCKVFTEARSSKRELYKKTTLIGLRHGINRHLANTDSKFDIVNGTEFKQSQVAFKAMVVDLKKEGKGDIEHHPPLDKGDLVKLYEYFQINRDFPEVQQCNVFVNIMLHFGRRGRENLRDMKISDFWMKTDSDGLRYVFINRDELTKNHQTDTNTAEGRMFEIRDSDRCPVMAFIRYKRKLNPGFPFLFQRARTTPNEQGYYFDRAPIGHNKLGSMMAVLSEKAGLSSKYTNHSLRATSVHILDAAQIPSRHIISVTGHKAEASLKTYTGHTDTDTKKHMLHTISDATVDENVVAKKSKLGNNDQTLNLQESVLVPLTNSQSDEVLDDLNSDPEFDQLMMQLSTNQPAYNSPAFVPPALKQSNSLTCNYNMVPGCFPWPQPMITGQNAHVSINYNIFNR